MATYVVGDLQGCFETFIALLERIDFSPDADRLLLTGDLVNRGPKSLETLRWASTRDTYMDTVLGNHEIFLLLRAFDIRPEEHDETLGPILNATDRSKLIDWIIHLPLYQHGEHGLLIHAGVIPSWDLSTLKSEAEAVQARLQATPDTFLRHYKERPTEPWSADDDDVTRACATLRMLTTIRRCLPDGTLATRRKGPFEPEDETGPMLPWFRHRDRHLTDLPIYYGHWASIGIHREANTLGVDSGCVWGKELTAYRIDDDMFFKEPSKEAQP